MLDQSDALKDHWVFTFKSFIGKHDSTGYSSMQPLTWVIPKNLLPRPFEMKPVVPFQTDKTRFDAAVEVASRFYHLAPQSTNAHQARLLAMSSFVLFHRIYTGYDVGIDIVAPSCVFLTLPMLPAKERAEYYPFLEKTVPQSMRSKPVGKRYDDNEPVAFMALLISLVYPCKDEITENEEVDDMMAKVFPMVSWLLSFDDFTLEVYQKRNAQQFDLSLFDVLKVPHLKKLMQDENEASMTSAQEEVLVTQLLWFYEEAKMKEAHHSIIVTHELDTIKELLKKMQEKGGFEEASVFSVVKRFNCLMKGTTESFLSRAPIKTSVEDMKGYFRLSHPTHYADDEFCYRDFNRLPETPIEKVLHGMLNEDKSVQLHCYNGRSMKLAFRVVAPGCTWRTESTEKTPSSAESVVKNMNPVAGLSTIPYIYPLLLDNGFYPRTLPFRSSSRRVIEYGQGPLRSDYPSLQGPMLVHSPPLFEPLSFDCHKLFSPYPSIRDLVPVPLSLVRDQGNVLGYPDALRDNFNESLIPYYEYGCNSVERLVNAGYERLLDVKNWQHIRQAMTARQALRGVKLVQGEKPIVNKIFETSMLLPGLYTKFSARSEFDIEIEGVRMGPREDSEFDPVRDGYGYVSDGDLKVPEVEGRSFTPTKMSPVWSPSSVAVDTAVKQKGEVSTIQDVLDIRVPFYDSFKGQKNKGFTVIPGWQSDKPAASFDKVQKVVYDAKLTPVPQQTEGTSISHRGRVNIPYMKMKSDEHTLKNHNPFFVLDPCISIGV